jgi:hypothetical protein
LAGDQPGSEHDRLEDDLEGLAVCEALEREPRRSEMQHSIEIAQAKRFKGLELALC